jgi:hypothetical protein
LRKYVIGAAVVVTALITAAVALAVTQRTFVQNFATSKNGASTQKPNKPTGTFLSEKSTDPANPQNHQPKQDSYVDDTFPSGATIDQSVAASCTATDNQIVQNPNGACPAKSKVGSGSAKVRLKFNGGADLNATVKAFSCKTGCKPPAGSGVSNKNEVILYVNPGGSNQVILRGTVSVKNGSPKIHVPIPITCVLGNCTTNGDARIAQLDLTIDKFVVKKTGKPDKAFLKTPKTCPASKKWRFSILFHGRDGKNQSKTSDVACKP